MQAHVLAVDYIVPYIILEIVPSCRELNSLQEYFLQNCSSSPLTMFNPLASEFFLLSSALGTEIIVLHNFTWHAVFFMFTVWYEHFSLVLVFPGLRI